MKNEISIKTHLENADGHVVADGMQICNEIIQADFRSPSAFGSRIQIRFWEDNSFRVEIIAGNGDKASADTMHTKVISFQVKTGKFETT